MIDIALYTYKVILVAITAVTGIEKQQSDGQMNLDSNDSSKIDSVRKSFFNLSYYDRQVLRYYSVKNKQKHRQQSLHDRNFEYVL